MTFLKKIFFFITFFLSIIIFVHFFLILFADTYRFFTKKNNKLNVNIAEVSKLDIYKEIDWSEEFFREYSSLKQNYKSYIGWRTKKFKGNHINIDKDGIRSTIFENNSNDELKNLFFGGSVTWGYGSDDANTIPSHYSLISNEKSKNLGERSWVLDQDLIYLIQQYNKLKSFTNVFFIQGINDIFIKCKSNDLYIHGQEKIIQNKINKQKIDSASFENFFSVFNKYLKIVEIKLNQIFKSTSKNISDINYCSDKNYAKLVAENIIFNFHNAKKIAKLNNDNFFAILQPIHFYSENNYHLTNSYDWVDKESFMYIYDLISKSEEGMEYFIDLKDMFKNTDEIIFIDKAGHLTPNGNRIFAERLYFEKKKRLKE